MEPRYSIIQLNARNISRGMDGSYKSAIKATVECDSYENVEIFWNWIILLIAWIVSSEW
jgi:hypothetical protein